MNSVTQSTHATRSERSPIEPPHAEPPGTVTAGDRVDVLATFATGQPHTETVVSGAEVLVVMAGQGLDELGAGTTVVLLVSPEVAERLAFARAFADISLAVAPPTSAA